MIEKILKYKEVIPIILLILYALGYTYVKLYYSEFGINIENYIALTDILFITLNILISLSLFLLLITILNNSITYIFLSIYYTPVYFKKKVSKEVYERFFDIKYYWNFNSLTAILLTVLLFVFISVTSEFLYASIVYWLLIMYKFSASKTLKSRSNKNENNLFRNVMLVFALAALLMFNIALAYKNADDSVKSVTYFNKPKVYQFIYGSTKVNTTPTSNQKFIGETTDYIFIYNSDSNKSSIYKKDDLENLEIISPDKVSDSNIKYYINLKKLLKKIIEGKLFTEK